VLVAVATVAGAWLARRGWGREGLWLAVAAGALLVIAGLHLLPDAWAAADEAGLPVWAVPTAAVGSFVLAGTVARKGCPCEPEKAGGTGSAGALAVHRFLESSALAVVGSLTLAAALAVHALAEGLAVGVLLDSRPRRQTAAWLVAMCLSPAAGAWAAGAGALPAAADPLLLAVSAGVLAQAARVSLQAASRRAPTGRFLAAGDGLAVLVAAGATALAVLAAG
jgi:ZIP family zinc transporter